MCYISNFLVFSFYSNQAAYSCFINYISVSNLKDYLLLEVGLPNLQLMFGRHWEAKKPDQSLSNPTFILEKEAYSYIKVPAVTHCKKNSINEFCHVISVSYIS